MRPRRPEVRLPARVREAHALGRAGHAVMHEHVDVAVGVPAGAEEVRGVALEGDVAAIARERR